MRSLCDLLFGMVDVCAFLLIILPLYPNVVDGYVYSVSLLAYTQSSPWILSIYWLMFVSLIVSGILKIVLVQLKIEKKQKVATGCSIGLSVFAVLFLAMTRQAYVTMIVFVLLVIKGILLLKY